MTSDETLAAMYIIAEDNPPLKIALELCFAKTNEKFVDLVDRAIDYLATEFAMNKHAKQGLNEDQLSVEIVSNLKSMGFKATKDTQIGGHCDIVVQKGNLLWIGEAKIHTSNNWIWQGFEQLDRRYSTGLPGQDHGGVIIYCFRRDVSELMDSWANYLPGKRSDVKVETCPRDPLSRVTTHKHSSTGLDFTVRHKPFALFWEPTK